MRRRVALVSTVWGDRFTDFFADLCVASLLADGNLPALVRDCDVAFYLYTDAPSLARFRRSAAWDRLAALVQIRPVALEDLPRSAIQGHWGQWQHAAATLADRSDTLILVIPDCIYMDGALPRIAAALNEADAVYYALPQVSQELAEPMLRRLVSERGALALSATEIADLFVDYVNPKHAVAEAASPYIVGHPEYVIRADAGGYAITELACHPLAIRSGYDALSYSFAPLHAERRLAFLEILGVSCEPTLKFVEQYFRWPKLGRALSRLLNLGSWIYTFREPGAIEYAGTSAVVTRHQGRATAQARMPTVSPRLRHANATMELGDIVFRLFSLAGQASEPVRAALALAFAVPSIRRQLRRVEDPVTVLIPVIVGDFEAVIAEIERRGDLDRDFMQFLMLHVLPGRLALPVHREFALDRTRGTTRLMVVEPALAGHCGYPVGGRTISHSIDLGPKVLAYYVELNYGDAGRLVDRLSAGTRPSLSGPIGASQDAMGAR